MMPELADDLERRERRTLRSFVIRTIVGIVGGFPFGAALMVSGFVEGFSEHAPRAAVNNIDAFLTPLCAWILTTAFVGAIVSLGEGIRSSRREVQLKATRFCVLLGILVAFGFYGLAGWGLPLLSRHRDFPSGIPADRALEVHPFMLTPPELRQVQATFRRAGGFSRRVALTQELRIWLAVTIPTLAAVAMVALLIRRPRSRFIRVIAVEAIALAFFVLGAVLTVGPAILLRPARGPFSGAWVVVGITALGSAWWLRRRLRDPAGAGSTGRILSPA